MKIFFDFDTPKFISRNDISNDSDAKIIIDELHSFIETRLKLLEHEINSEPEGYILINMGKPEIRYFYSKELSMKMMESITENDFKYIMLKIYYSLNQQ